MRKKKAIWQLLTVILLWFCVVAGTMIAFAIREGGNRSFPVSEIEKFVAFPQLVSLGAGGVLLFLLFKAFGHRGPDDERRRGDFFADLALDEMGSALYHLGSLSFVCGIFGASHWYFILALASLFLGYKLKLPEPQDLPRSAPREA